MQIIEYGPGGVFAKPKRGKYQHRHKVDTDGRLLWPLCYARISTVQWSSDWPSSFTPMCPQCERRHQAAGWLPMGEVRQAS